MPILGGPAAALSLAGAVDSYGRMVTDLTGNQPRALQNAEGQQQFREDPHNRNVWIPQQPDGYNGPLITTLINQDGLVTLGIGIRQLCLGYSASLQSALH